MLLLLWDQASTKTASVSATTEIERRDATTTLVLMRPNVNTTSESERQHCCWSRANAECLTLFIGQAIRINFVS